jgi:hypothetical protein
LCIPKGKTDAEEPVGGPRLLWVCHPLFAPSLEIHRTVDEVFRCDGMEVLGRRFAHRKLKARRPAVA